MKLLRHGEKGAERPGMLDADGRVRDLSGLVPDIGGPVLGRAGRAMLAGLDPATLPPVPDGTRLGPPVAGVGKIVCIGLNYADHAAESGMEVPPEPVIFMKATSALAGPDDPIVLPRGSEATDWECELVAVIGDRAKDVDEADALDHVAGYAVGNDVSERHWQLERAGQWTKGKSFDGFAPIGPWLVTADEVADPQDLPVWLTLNGERMQDGSTSTMVYGVAHVVSFLSRIMSLHPGDLIMTGTPPGVGMGQTPKRYLRPGDRIELGVGALGTQSAEIVATE